MAVLSTFRAVLRDMLDIFSPTIMRARFTSNILKNLYSSVRVIELSLVSETDVPISFILIVYPVPAAAVPPS